MKRKAIFLDKDGTLIPDIPYNADPSLVSLSPGAAEGLQLLASCGYVFVLITNQSGIARGYFTEADIGNVFDKLQDLLAASGIQLAGIYFCPHHPEGTVEQYSVSCNCRKPMPGMIIRAAEELDIDPTASWMIGDILNDVEAGKLAGCRTVLIDNGNETKWEISPSRTPDFNAKDLREAVRYILKSSNCGQHEKQLAAM